MPYLGACEICLYVGSVVRDHDHRNGVIRGWLCNRCNRYLGVYENRHRFGNVYPDYAPRRRFKAWVKRFRDEILKHLAKYSGIGYQADGEARPESLTPRERDLRDLIPKPKSNKPQRRRKARKRDRYYRPPRKPVEMTPEERAQKEAWFEEMQQHRLKKG